jgi:protein TonB
VQRWRLAIAIVLALLLHAALAFGGLARLFELGNFARRVQAGMQQRLHAEIQVALQPEPPEPPPPPPEEPRPEPPPEPAPKPAAKAPTPKEHVPEPAAPAAAQAGRVLTAEPDPDEPVDLTGTTFVQGNADAYAGGVTASNGTATHAVHAPTARADGVPGGTGTAPAGPDRSRPAGLAELTWATCPFPPEADGINLERVRIMVTVSAQGKPLDVQVLSNPGHGFSREAQRCARNKTYQPALDRNGKSVVSTVTILVTFERR